jgi:hypothetical protein
LVYLLVYLLHRNHRRSDVSFLAATTKPATPTAKPTIVQLVKTAITAATNALKAAPVAGAASSVLTYHTFPPPLSLVILFLFS